MSDKTNNSAASLIRQNISQPQHRGESTAPNSDSPHSGHWDSDTGRDRGHRTEGGNGALNGRGDYYGRGRRSCARCGNPLGPVDSSLCSICVIRHIREEAELQALAQSAMAYTAGTMGQGGFQGAYLRLQLGHGGVDGYGMPSPYGGQGGYGGHGNYGGPGEYGSHGGHAILPLYHEGDRMREARNRLLSPADGVRGANYRERTPVRRMPCHYCATTPGLRREAHTHDQSNCRHLRFSQLPLYRHCATTPGLEHAAHAHIHEECRRISRSSRRKAGKRNRAAAAALSTSQP